MTDIVYATTNPGKFAEVKKIFKHHGLEIKSPSDYGVKVEVEETGKTLEENAKLKAEAFLDLLPEDIIVIGDDTGVEIDALGGEPGIKVRRWKGYPMSDEEIINYCLERMENVPLGERGAQFRTVLAVAKKGEVTQFFDGVLKGEILMKPINKRREGMPFWPLFYDPKLKMSLGEMHEQPVDFQLKHPTHREIAVLKVLPYLAKYLT